MAFVYHWVDVFDSVYPADGISHVDTQEFGLQYFSDQFTHYPDVYYIHHSGTYSFQEFLLTVDPILDMVE